MPVTQSDHTEQSGGTGMARGDGGYCRSRDMAASCGEKGAEERIRHGSSVRVAGEDLLMLHVWRIQARKGKRLSPDKDLGA